MCFHMNPGPPLWPIMLVVIFISGPVQDGLSHLESSLVLLSCTSQCP